MIYLSVLIPSIPSRIDSAMALLGDISVQDGDGHVEVLVFTDNRKRSIGQKRDALVQMAKGKYLTFVDDDDQVSVDFVFQALSCIKEHGIPGPDIITYDHHVTINGREYVIISDHRHPIDEQLHEHEPGVLRRPCHSDIIRTEIARRHRFKDLNYGEDADWTKRVLKDCHSGIHIDEVLHHYVYNDHLTAASREKDAVNKGGHGVRPKVQVIK